MSIIELLIIAVALSMDAFAIAVSSGLTIEKFTLGKATKVGLYFGISQAVMPIIGYLAAGFIGGVTAYDHWIIFALLTFIGGKMIYESFGTEHEKFDKDDSLRFAKMFPLAIATSIDALAVGISFALLKVNIILASSFIGITTLLLSIVGVKIGNLFGLKYKNKAEFLGGAILVLMGLKILFEHLGLISL